jgi:hypothetical protein
MEYHSNEMNKVVEILKGLGFEMLKSFEGPFGIGRILAVNGRTHRWK